MELNCHFHLLIYGVAWAKGRSGLRSTENLSSQPEIEPRLAEHAVCSLVPVLRYTSSQTKEYSYITVTVCAPRFSSHVGEHLAVLTLSHGRINRFRIPRDQPPSAPQPPLYINIRYTLYATRLAATK